MADDSNAPDNPVKVKRRLKTEPETIRSRAEKRQLQQDSTEVKTRNPFASFLWGFTWPLRALGHQIAKLNRFKVFRVIGLILLPRYIRNSWLELKKVTWPDWRLSWRLTYAVLIFAVIFGLVVFVVDFGLDKLFKEFIVKS